MYAWTSATITIDTLRRESRCFLRNLVSDVSCLYGLVSLQDANREVLRILTS